MSARPTKRALRLSVAIGGFLLAGVVVYVIATNSLPVNSALAGIVGTVLALGTSYVLVWRWLHIKESEVDPERKAEELTLQLLRQWIPEFQHRVQLFGDNRIIPLSWKQVKNNSVAMRFRSTGMVLDNPDEAAESLAAAFNHIPSGRLVLIGEPGAGKTFLGVTLIVGLLRDRLTNGRRPVPVLLSLASWDPVSDDLDSWVIRSLANDHFNGAPLIPRVLTNHQLLLPILDGLDEIPEQLRRKAVSRINEKLHGSRSLVLTCRSVEYADGLAGGAPELLRAPVVEVQPLEISDINAHLRKADTKVIGWLDVVEHIRANPTGPLREALTTPLMLSLFSTAYQTQDARELLDQTLFGTRHAIEDRMFDRFVDSVYPDVERPPQRGSRRWTTPAARTWLRYLASYLHQHGERDFRWWLLERRAVSAWVALLPGLVVGVVVFVVSSLPNSLASSAVLGLVSAAIVSLLWLVSERSAASRATGFTGQATPGFRRGFVSGGLLILVPGLPLIFAVYVDRTLDAGQVIQLWKGTGVLLALSLVSGLAVGVHEYMASRAIKPGRADPEGFLRQDRRSCIWGFVVTAALVGTLSGVFAALGAALGNLVGERFALLSDTPSVISANASMFQDGTEWAVSSLLGSDTILNTTVILLFAVAVLTTRAWPRFLVARLYLGISGKLPLRLMSFLADARDRGVLRTAGGSYQFWHARLQERLAATATPTTVAGRTRGLRVAALGVVGVLALSITVIVLAQKPDNCEDTGYDSVDKSSERAFIGNISACFGRYEEDDLRTLLGKDASDKLNGIARSGDPATQDLPVLVFGEFDRMPKDELNSVVDGLVAGARLIDPPPQFVLMNADVNQHSNDDVERLLDLFLLNHREYVSGGYVISLLHASESSVSTDEGAVGVKGLRAEQIRARYRDDLTGYRAASYTSPYLAATNIGDGIDGAECDRLAEYIGEENSNGYEIDLTQIAPSRSLVTKIHECANVDLVINQSWIAELESWSERPNLYYIEFRDESMAVLQECRVALDDPPAESEALALCMATHGAIEDMGLTWEPVFEPE